MPIADLRCMHCEADVPFCLATVSNTIAKILILEKQVLELTQCELLPSQWTATCMPVSFALKCPAGNQKRVQMMRVMTELLSCVASEQASKNKKNEVTRM